MSNPTLITFQSCAEVNNLHAITNIDANFIIKSFVRCFARSNKIIG
jgi:hypothetical protein